VAARRWLGWVLASSAPGAPRGGHRAGVVMPAFQTSVKADPAPRAQLADAFCGWWLLRSRSLRLTGNRDHQVKSLTVAGLTSWERLGGIVEVDPSSPKLKG